MIAVAPEALPQHESTERLLAHLDAVLELWEHGLAVLPALIVPRIRGPNLLQRILRSESPRVCRRLVQADSSSAWLALSGERLDAPTALTWGLVDEIHARLAN